MRRTAPLGLLVTLIIAALVVLARAGGVTPSSMPRQTNAPRMTAREYRAFMDSVVLLASQKLRPAQRPAGQGHLLGAAQHGAIAFLYIAYPLQRPLPGCVGTIAFPVLYVDGHWQAGGWFGGWSCLSRQTPLTFDYYSSSLYSISAVYARALPAVKSVRIIQDERTQTVPLKHDAYLGFVSCTDIRQAEALDARGHMLYAQSVARCP